jgi:serine-type D-Ala-D-Ala carboxypeptidase/endopeptidase (penicillin-binding protein 4)
MTFGESPQVADLAARKSGQSSPLVAHSAPKGSSTGEGTRMHVSSFAFRRSFALALAVVLLGAVPPSDVPASLGQTIADVTGKPLYQHASWGITVLDESSGAVLVDQWAQKMFVPGSIMKTYSVAAMLKAYGPDFRFRTPVYQIGSVSGGVLTGNLVLVGSGDFSFGLRERPDGTLAFNNFPEIDHNYADTGFAGPVTLENSDPLAALNELARKVRTSGIRSVRGNVAIDDRLFTPYTGWPDGIISPIWINENLIDITASPGARGKPARVDWRPKTASIRVVGSVETVAAGTKTKALVIEAAGPGTLRISGQLAADAKPVLNVSKITNPAAFARTAFIEALGRAGVSVSASPGGANPAAALPNAATYAKTPKVAEHVSPPLSQFIKVVLKVSYNRGADDLVCMVAAKSGSRNCSEGLTTELQTIQALGVSKESTIVEDGAGSIDSGRTAPADQATFLRMLPSVPWGHYVRDGMAVLGVDGTQATNQVGMPAAGHVRVKDGSRVAGNEAGQFYLAAKTQVGYIDAKSGRKLTYAVFVNNVPLTAETIFERFTTADHDIGTIVAAIQQAY